MTRNLQRNRQGVATCQLRDYSGTRWRSCFCLSLSPSISLWPRYFASLFIPLTSPNYGFASTSIKPQFLCFLCLVSFFPHPQSHSSPLLTISLHSPLPFLPLSLLFFSQCAALFPNISTCLDLWLMRSLASEIIFGIFN